MERLLLEMSRSIDTRSEQKYPLNFEIVERALVPDEIGTNCSIFFVDLISLLYLHFLLLLLMLYRSNKAFG